MNALTAHAQTVTKAAKNGVADRKLLCLHRKMAALNSNMMLDFKWEVVVWLKLHTRSEKSPK